MEWNWNVEAILLASYSASRCEMLTIQTALLIPFTGFKKYCSDSWGIIFSHLSIPEIPL